MSSDVLDLKPLLAGSTVTVSTRIPHPGATEKPFPPTDWYTLTWSLSLGDGCIVAELVHIDMEARSEEYDRPVLTPEELVLSRRQDLCMTLQRYVDRAKTEPKFANLDSPKFILPFGADPSKDEFALKGAE